MVVACRSKENKGGTRGRVSHLLPAEACSHENDRFSVVIVTNQNLKPAPLKKWREKVQGIVGDVSASLCVIHTRI